MVRNQKKTGTKRKPSKTSQKPKVYIPAYKIIILCTIIITISMILLFATTLLSKKDQASIADRFEDKSTKIEKVENKQDIEKNPPKLPQKEITDKVISNKKKEASNKKTDNNPQNKTLEKSEIKNKDKNKDKSDCKPLENSKPEETMKKEPDSKVIVQEEKIENKSFGFPLAENNAQLIFVFDDGGHNLAQTKAFLDLPFPFTVAVLPKLAFSKESAELVRQSGNEVILHQPMQAINLNVDPGPGAIKPNMTEDQILSTLFQNVTEIGPIAGMNNHEGSAITADAEKMAIVLKFCSSEGIFFLDSRTNKDTAVPEVAKALGYSYFERNIFLDNEKTRENILGELKKGLTIANKNGSVIMIGHIWSAEILPGILKEVYPELKEKGYTFSVVSKSKARKN